VRPRRVAKPPERPLDDAHLNQALKALADRKRFRILREVVAAGEMTCGQVGERIPLSQPTISHHLHVLAEAGLLTVRRVGQQGLVSVNRDAIEAIPRLMMDRIFGESPEAGPQTTVRAVRAFAASPERVFAACTEGELLRRWMFPRPTEAVETARVDARLGGSFAIRVRRGHQVAEHVGDYLAFAPPTHLEFTWCLADEEAKSRVTLDFAATPDGCELSVQHVLDPDWATEARRIEGVWAMMLDTLAELLAG
jgi:ArsR family transcriptional regulator